MSLFDRVPLWIFVLFALTLGLAPFRPEPHIWEKLGMLLEGTLSRPVDVFDLVLHATPWGLLVLKLARMVLPRVSQ